ncbi:MAG: copper resistance protein CopC [Flaviflexus sp.]|nr:copper resistance protein CopC [Flaviflexus sp.]
MSVLSLMVVGAMLVLPMAGPALAHDSLVGSDPSEGEVVEEAPDRAVLTFSGRLIDIAPQTILSRDGEQVDTAPAQIDGYDLITDLPELAGGDYRLAYSVVSSDGHRIEGAVDFTVAGADTTPTRTSPPGDDATDSAAGEGPDSSATADGQSTSVTIIRWTGIIVVILGVSVIITRYLRRR